MRITIDTANAAFTDDGNGGASECSRILHKLANRLEDRGMPRELNSWPLKDSNGNTVGRCSARQPVFYSPE